MKCKSFIAGHCPGQGWPADMENGPILYQFSGIYPVRQLQMLLQSGDKGEVPSGRIRPDKLGQDETCVDLTGRFSLTELMRIVGIAEKENFPP